MIKRLSTFLRVGIVWIFLAMGILLLWIGATMEGRKDLWGTAAHILEPVGATLFAVCVIHFLDHAIFSDVLRGEVTRVIEELLLKHNHKLEALNILRVRQVFISRSSYRSKYDINLSFASRTSSLFSVGGSLLQLIRNRGTILEEMVRSGFTVSLCLMDPRSWTEETRALTSLEKEDIITALRNAKEIAEDLAGNPEGVGDSSKQTAANGTFEVRLHRIVLHDSAMFFIERDHRRVSWDWNFGKDPDRKPVLVAEESGHLYELLRNRYDSIWRHSRPVITYKDRKLDISALSEILTRDSELNLKANPAGR